MLFPRIITEICIAQNGAGPINRPVISSHAPRQSELPRPIKIRPRMYVRQSIMYEKAAFCSPEENSSVAR